ncbi:MAG: NifB/NifX family molybdenum-iron cluster-binding protein [Promethearchaeota archaeon]
MKTRICITAQGPTLDAPIDLRFGRCANFIFVDSRNMKFESAPNPGAMTGGGAGIQAAQFVVDHQAKVVLTGHVGPNAYHALNSGGVEVYTGISGSVNDAIKQFQNNQLTRAASSTAPAHTGIGSGRGRGGGRGGGRNRW